MHRRGGPRSHPGMVSHGWGLSTLSGGAVYGSPVSACTISSRGTGLIPGPGSIPSVGASHGWRIAEGSKCGGHAAGQRRVHGRDCDREQLRRAAVGEVDVQQGAEMGMEAQACGCRLTAGEKSEECD